MSRWVDITFDCLPLRTITRMDIPLDASPKYQALCQRIQQAIERHGSHNSYYLYNAKCAFHVTNHAELGLIEFRFEGVVLTDVTDQKSESADVQVELVRETCDWLREPIVHWFLETVPHAVCAEFDRFIEAGDLEQARQRLAKIQAASDQSGGYLGMYL